MAMAAFSLTALKNSTPFSPELSHVSVTAPASPSDPVSHALETSGMVVPLLPATSLPLSERKVYKAARKARSVTQLVLVDGRDSEASPYAPSTLEAAGLTMPPPVP